MERDDRIENKLDSIIADMGEVKITIAKQHVVLVEHESRSTKLESIVLPLYKKAIMVEGVLKFVGLLGVIAGIVEVIRMFK